ncbi:MAG TPA: serine--tRNA ligase [Fimbriimonadaceae bacterium]|nr:serine--tRNA ligase [Fimbriimonadaceae bacterium]
MLDRNFIRREPDAVKAGAKRKGIDVSSSVDEWLKTDEAWRALGVDLQAQQAEMNRISKSIGMLMGQGKKEEAEAAKAQTKDLKDAISVGEPKSRDLEARMAELELGFPNIPDESVPDGTSADDNVVVREWGEKPAFAEKPQAHWDVAERLKLLDLPRGAKISGSGFALYTGLGARLQRALFTWMVDHQTLRNGYREIYPPYMVNSASLTGTGQLPKFEEDLYKADDDLYLIPTAEVPVTNIYRDEILDNEMLTVRMAAYSGCFRKEAGAAGKDTRGLLRMHQFDKVELVKLTRPEESYDELEALTKDAESVLQTLGLHYRVVVLCGGDMSFSNAKCYDLEVWSPGVEKYLEISSCSNFTDFQARRANIRFRRAQGEKPEFVHTLNGSGLATPRLFSAILETFQQPDGSVLLPEVLRPYVGVDRLEGV